MTSSTSSTSGFSFSQARSLIDDLNRPKPWIYWTDFLVSIFTGQLAIHLILLLPKRFPDAAWAWQASARYHALHHLFPRLPYHNLGKAQARLVNGLPADSPYHRTIATSLSSELMALWSRARESEFESRYSNRMPDTLYGN